MGWRVGILGAGKVVDSSHLPVLLSLPGVEVKWVIDADLQRARMVEQMYSVRSLPIESFHSALDEVDICLLAVPIGVRAKYFSACANRGIAVYSEKPFASTILEHDNLCAQFEPHKIAAGFQRRFHAGIQCVRSLLSDGRFGKLREVRLTAGTYDLKSGGANRFTTKANLAGGGVIIESRIHELDQIVFATRASHVKSVEAKGIVFDDIDYHCETQGELVCPEGTVPVHCTISRFQNLTERMTFLLDRGVLSLGLKANSIPRLDLAIQPVSSKFGTTIIAGFHCFWENFLAGLTNQIPNDTSAFQSRATTLWVESIYRAIKKEGTPLSRMAGGL